MAEAPHSIEGWHFDVANIMGRNSILRQVPYKMTAEDVKARVMEHLAKMPYALQENQFIQIGICREFPKVAYALIISSENKYVWRC